MSALITCDCSAISAPIGRCAVANHDDSAGLSRTLRSDDTMPSMQPLAWLVDAGELFGHLVEQPVAFAVHVRGVQRFPVLEVAVQRRARTPCGLGDFVHADGRGVLLGEQRVGGVEDAVGGHLGPAVAQPVVARHHAVTRNGTDSGRRT